MDVLKQIEKEHEEIIKKFEACEEEPTKACLEEIAPMIRNHFSAESTVFEPVAEQSEQKKSFVAELIEQHKLISRTLEELLEQKYDKAVFKAKFGVLMELVETHFKAESGEFFRHAKESITQAGLEKILKDYESGAKATLRRKDQAPKGGKK